MNDTQIRCFLAVAREKSYTEAASSVYLSQQAVSKYIMNLEQELGTTLFLRRHGKVELTEAGEYYRRLLSAWTDELTHLRDESRQRAEELRRSMCVGYSIWLDPLGEAVRGLRAFQQQNPQLCLHIRHLSNGELLTSLTEGTLDVALMPSDQLLLPGSCEHAFLARDRMCFYAPANVPGEKMDRACWGLPFLAVPSWEWSPQEWARISRQELSQLGIEPREIITLPNLPSLLATMQIGPYVTLADDRFGYLHAHRALRRFPIASSTGLIGVWARHSEHPFIGPFIQHMQQLYRLDER